MKRLIDNIPWILGFLVFPVSLVIIPKVLPAEWEYPQYLRILVALILTSVVLIVVWIIGHREQLSSWWKRKRLEKFNGIEGIADKIQRSAEFNRVYRESTTSVYCWGVGMTKLSQDLETIEDHVRSGKRVVLEMIDPEWARERPEVSQLLNDFYDREDFVVLAAESRNRFVRLIRKLEREHGEGRIELHLVQMFFPQSGTIADFDTDEMWGYLESHTPRIANAQLRVRIRNYVPSNPNTRPYIQEVLEARRKLPKTRHVVSTQSGDQTK